jgi:hypothetical protein
LRLWLLLPGALAGLACGGEDGGGPSNQSPVSATIEVWSCLPGTCQTRTPIDTVNRGDSILVVFVAVDSTRTVDSLSVRSVCALNATFTLGPTAILTVPATPTCPDSIERVAMQVLPTHHAHEVRRAIRLPAAMPIGSYRVRSRLFVAPPVSPAVEIEVQ